jgi:hypothetical protein
MAISNDLFNALLSLDAYNRGYDAHLGSSTDGLGGLLSKIGDATVIAQDGDATARDASFFAQAYSRGGQTIISYRGTDSLLDVVFGWITGAGAFGPQAQLAFDFYKAVTGQSVWDGPVGNVLLTGHSLGGGLAGLVASLTGDRAEIYDNMPYAGAATLAALERNIGLGTIDLASLVAGTAQPAFPLPNSTNITGVNISGEALDLVRAAGPDVAAAEGIGVRVRFLTTESARGDAPRSLGERS